MSLRFKILLFLPESSDKMPQFCRDNMVLLTLSFLELIDLVLVGSTCSVSCHCRSIHQEQMQAAFRFLETLVEEDYFVDSTAQFREFCSLAISRTYYRCHFDIESESLNPLTYILEMVDSARD